MQTIPRPGYPSFEDWEAAWIGASGRGYASTEWPGFRAGRWPAPVINEAKTVTVKTRQRILARDGGRCRACGSTRALEIDHVFPRRRGGGNEDGNLQALCHDDNARKRDRYPWASPWPREA